MKKEEVDVAPDGSLRLSPFEIERKARYFLTIFESEGVKATAENLRSLAKQSLWEDSPKTLGIVVDTILSQVRTKSNKCEELSILCLMVFDDLSLGCTHKYLLMVVEETCWKRYERFWQSMFFKVNDYPNKHWLTGREFVNPGQSTQETQGQALVVFIGYLYRTGVLSSKLVIHIINEHGRNLAGLSIEALETFYEFLNTVMARLLFPDCSHEELEPTIRNIRLARSNLLIPLERRNLLGQIIVNFDKWELSFKRQHLPYLIVADEEIPT